MSIRVSKSGKKRVFGVDSGRDMKSSCDVFERNRQSEYVAETNFIINLTKQQYNGKGVESSAKRILQN